MLLFLQIIFWLSVAAMVHTYILYPMLMRLLAQNKAPNHLFFDRKIDKLPQVSVLMAVHNEEKVIQEKLDSLLGLDYPQDSIQFYIGSDCSSDTTNAIVKKRSEMDVRIHFLDFQKRQGKPNIINQLAERCFQTHPASAHHIFLLTDASVMLKSDTLWHLVKHFRNPQISIVDTHLHHTGMKNIGISKSEDQYISGEVLLKYREGVVWGKMLGAFGGCYAIRSNYFTPVPKNFLVDDFFIALKALEQNTLAINDPKAISYESVSHEMHEEYRRKARISAGNFQNLRTFVHLLKPFTPLGFAFLSHKVLRWFGPFFMLAMLFSSLILCFWGNYLFCLLLYGQVFLYIGIPLLDFLFKTINIHSRWTRNITYFLYMNLALLRGFFNYIKGIQSNVWKPPKRN